MPRHPDSHSAFHLGPPLSAALIALVLSHPAGGVAQDSNIIYPIAAIEARLGAPEIRVIEVEAARDPRFIERSRRVTLAGSGADPPIEAHWKPVAPPGEGFNNEPRYALAAYQFQKMFLSEAEYVVPPTVLRAMPVEAYREMLNDAEPTIRGTRSVLFLLTYWIQNLAVDTTEPFHPRLFDLQPVYARHFANANLFTFLINHKDGNAGNLVVSLDGANQRVFSIDNDVAFSSRDSDRGDRWRRLHVNRLPAATLERLRSITTEQLQAQLGVLAEFAVVDRMLVPVAPGENLNPRQGVRVNGGRVQFGLTSEEIDDLESRIRNLLRDVDRGELTTF